MRGKLKSWSFAPSRILSVLTCTPPVRSVANHHSFTTRNHLALNRASPTRSSQFPPPLCCDVARARPERLLLGRNARRSVSYACALLNRKSHSTRTLINVSRRAAPGIANSDVSFRPRLRCSELGIRVAARHLLGTAARCKQNSEAIHFQRCASPSAQLHPTKIKPGCGPRRVR